MVSKSGGCALAGVLSAVKNSLPTPLYRGLAWLRFDQSSPLRRLFLWAGGMRVGEIPAPTPLPDSPIRVYIGPANYAGQAQLWARALDNSQAPVEARNMAVVGPDGFRFSADSEIPLSTYLMSHRWRDREYRRVQQFTHVLYEAERPLFADKFGFSVEREVRALRSSGISVAALSHGSDTRNPATNRALTPWSPFWIDRPENAILQKKAAENRELLGRLEVPVFVSTPELIDDLPGAHWCPTIADRARWLPIAETPILRGGPPTVMHLPSKGWVKGSEAIELALRPLDQDGLIRYRRPDRVDPRDVPRTFAGADIVVEQVRMGIYSATAVEAMMAGRVVVAHVAPSVRRRVRELTGMDLPVVEANPATLRDVVAALVADRGEMERIARDGTAFALAVHSGAFSARVLQDNWVMPLDR